MRILIVGVGLWNDVQYGNNVMTNWFEGYNAEFANIYVHKCNSVIACVKCIWRLPMQ